MSTLASFPDQDGQRLRFAEEVRVLMARRNINQTILAGVMGIGQSEVSKRLRGIVAFQFDEIGLLADYFGVAVATLFGEDASPRPNGPGGGGGTSADTPTSFDSRAPSTSLYAGHRLSIAA